MKKLLGKEILILYLIISFALVAIALIQSSAFGGNGNREKGRNIFHDKNLSPFGNTCSICHPAVEAELPHDTDIAPFNNSCSSCHPSVKDISNIKIGEDFADFLQKHYQTFMVADQPLTKEQLKDLQAYIMSIQIKK